jgi:hypothetical protein
VPLGLQDAVTWSESHPPPHLRSDGTSSVGGPDGTDSAGVEYTERATRDHHGLTAEVAVDPLDDTHAVVRVDALAAWLPRASPPHGDRRARRTGEQGGRCPAALHPAGPSRAGARARREPAAAGVGGLFDCGDDDGGHHVVHFTGGVPDPTFVVGGSGCGFIDVRTDGVTQPGLTGGFAVDDELTRILRGRVRTAGR